MIYVSFVLVILGGYWLKFNYSSIITYNASVQHSWNVKFDVIDGKNAGNVPASISQTNTFSKHYFGQSNAHTCRLMCDSTDKTVDTAQAGVNLTKFNGYSCNFNKILRESVMEIKIQAGLRNINAFFLFLICTQYNVQLLLMTVIYYSNFYHVMFGLVKMNIIYHILIQIGSNFGVCQRLQRITDEIDSICGYCTVFRSIITNFIVIISIVIDNSSPRHKRDVIGPKVFNFDGFDEAVLAVVAIITPIEEAQLIELEFVLVFLFARDILVVYQANTLVKIF